MIALGYVSSIIYALICLGIGFFAYKLGAPKKITRKIVHILIGFEWFILYHFFGGGIHFLIVCLFFLGILLLSHYKKLLPMIESDEDNSLGTVYYAVAMSIMALITLFEPDMILLFGMGVLCTSLGDGFAGLFGQLLDTPSNAKIYKNKTIYGTLFNAIVCFISVGVFQREFGLEMPSLYILFTALFATELELITGKGLDNISVTLGTATLAYFFLNFSGVENYILPILLTPLMIGFCLTKKALTLSGIVAAIILGIIVSIAFGNVGFLILMAFFLGGIITDKIKNKHKNKGRKNKKHIESRNHIQVLANGFVAMLSAIFYIITKSDLCAIAFTASLAEALADTSASGIGVICGRAYDPFRRRSCKPGISGGMSVLGTVTSAISAVVVSLIAFAFDFIDPIGVLIVSISAFLGAIFDSMLGSLLQVKYRCPVCGEITESAEHCNTSTSRCSGLAFVTNNAVNLFATIFSGVIAIVLYCLI